MIVTEDGPILQQTRDSIREPQTHDWQFQWPHDSSSTVDLNFAKHDFDNADDR